jgi:hypothetical protein
MNFTNMVSRVQTLVGTHSLATTTVVGNLINQRHEEILGNYDWARTKQEVILLTTTDKVAGTVTMTTGSPTAQGVGTAFAATDVGKSVRIGAADGDYVIYNVKAVNVGLQQFTLGDLNGTSINWPGTTGSNSYVMFTQFYPLGTGIRQILSVRYKAPLKETSQTDLDRIDARRMGIDPFPLYYARAPFDMSGSNDILRIEVYPRFSTAIAFNVGIELGHTTLSGTMNPLIPSDLLVWFAAYDTCMYLFAKTGSKDSKWMTLAKEFLDQGNSSIEFALVEDKKQFGVIQSVKDVGGDIPLSGTDFSITHDLGLT